MAPKVRIKYCKLVFVTLSLGFCINCFYWWNTWNLPINEYTVEDIDTIELGITCSCTKENKALRPQAVYGSKTFCQSLVTDRGLHQRVVSYCLHGDDHNEQIFKRYFSFLDEIAQQIAVNYPGWIMRIYHKYSATDTAFTKHLCSTYCQYGHVDLCNIADLALTTTSALPEDLYKAFPLLWRFLPIADPTVDVFLSRDLDSDITAREVAAVHFWLNSTNATLHAMADNPAHTANIMGGMWGARMEVPEKRGLLWKSFLEMKEKAGYTRVPGWDQEILKVLQSAVGESDMVRHDSYLCKWYPKSNPFPTKRIGNAFIGMPKYNGRGPVQKCPMECRPKEHQDWEHC